ncbi:hypothetical protein C8R43DRAFT_951967 [Mycena crocata]|nr:hypothetical protein C8R43DRAFT_951967 [Mycena crocata]
MPTMQTSATYEKLIQYTKLAATTAQDIAEKAGVPFMGSISALTSSILECVEEECAQMVEKIHEILCTIVKLYTKSESEGGLPTALLYNIGKFTETLQKVLICLTSQQKMGKLKQLFRRPENALKLETCKNELDDAQKMFKVYGASSTLSQVMQIKQSAKDHHEELIFLVEQSSFTTSDWSSLRETSSSLGSSCRSISMLPPIPKIFHGRESELQDIVKILMEDTARIAILGTGGIGKTSLATAALHDPQVENKYSQRYFVPCYTTSTCTELVAVIADHIGIAKGSKLSQKVIQHFMQTPASLLVLDNLDTPWESVSSRFEVEEFLSLLTDVPHLGLLLWDHFKNLDATNIVPQLSRNLGNINTVFRDALNTDFLGTTKTFQSILWLSTFYRRTQYTYSPLLAALSAHTVQLQNHQMYGDYLVKRLLDSVLPVADKKLIELGNQYFEAKDPLEQAKWYCALGTYFSIGNLNAASAIENFQKALSLSSQDGYPTRVGHSAHYYSSRIMYNMGNIIDALEHAKKAEEFAVNLGDIYSQAGSIHLQAHCQTSFANYEHAQNLLENSRRLLNSCGLQGGVLDMKIRNLEGEIHLERTQYLDSREIQVSVMSHLQPTSYAAIVANLNIALIDFATGIDSRLVKQRLETCSHQCEKLHGYFKTNMALCIDTVVADLNLRDGDQQKANHLFSKCVKSSSYMEPKLVCLERLADLSTAMNNVQTTLQWAGIFLAVALQTKGKLAIMKMQDMSDSVTKMWKIKEAHGSCK